MERIRDIASAIEAEIDHTSLSEVLAIIADICHEKEAHLRHNWQDASSAQEWEKAASLIMNASNKVNV